MSTPLQDSAMLVALNISQWTARKYDKVATNEVDRNHGAKDAGRYNKLLVDKAALDPMDEIAGAARQHHYSVTLPWGNQGERLLPATLFMDYVQTMGQFKAEFESRAAKFAAIYPQLVQDARQRLGTLYNPADYPTEVRSRFSFDTPVSPVASANDFRVNLNSEYVEAIKREITERQDAQRTEAVKHVWKRVREVVARIEETCSKEKPRIFDSMIESASQLIQVLPALNLNNDPELDRIAYEMKKLVVSPDVLRANPHRRADLAKAAGEVLLTLP